MDPNQAVTTQQDLQVLEVPLTLPAAPVETNIPVQESPKKGSPLMKIAIILALVAVLSVVAYVFRAKFFTAQPTPTPVAVATPTPTQEVTITIDKTEYKQGETIKITVRNGLDKSVWYVYAKPYPWWKLEKQEGGTWKSMRVLLPTLTEFGEQCIAPPPPLSIEEISYKLEPNSEINDIWNQRRCNVSIAFIEPGSYRFLFSYGLNIDSINEKTIYSNELTIKEKEISKSECKEKSDGTPCTVGLWYDELGRACGDQSCVGLGLGKCYKGECIYLEEYENLSKNL